MSWDLLQVTTPSIAYMLLGGFVVAFSMFSLLVRERLYINEVILGAAFGVLIGPHVWNIFDPRDWGSTVTLEVMRFVLATGLFAIGVELPRSYLQDHARGLLVLVVPTMAFGWVVIAAIIHSLFPHLDFVSSLTIAACLTPTDPIVCAAIVGGKFAEKHVPLNLRRILSAESAANDGLAYPFLNISLHLAIEASRTVAIEKWFLIGCLYQVVLGVVLGAVLGITFSNLMRFSHRQGFIDRESYVAQYLALVLLTMGIASTIGTDDLLAAFAAGSAVSWDGQFNVQTEDDLFSTVIDLLLNCVCFVYIGAWLPFASFNIPELGIAPYRLILLFVSVMILRRIPALLILYRWIPEIKDWKEALFSGHFGPLGVGALFMSSMAMKELPVPHRPPESQGELLAATLQPIVSFVVLGSIIIHGLSIPFFSVGREIRSRTLSRTGTRTLTTRDVPDWFFWMHRAPAVTSPPAEIESQADIERAVGRGTAREKSNPDPVNQINTTPITSGSEELQEVAVEMTAHRPELMTNTNNSEDTSTTTTAAAAAVPRTVHFPAAE